MIQKESLSAQEIEAAKAAFFARGGQVEQLPTRNIGSVQLRVRGIRMDDERVVN